MPDDDRDVDPATAASADQKPPRTRKSRHLLRLPFTKSGRRSKRRTVPPPPPPDEGDLGKGCYLCFLPPRSPPDAATGGGSKPPPTYEFLKSMIEKNDFYSPECNVHRDIPYI